MQHFKLNFFLALFVPLFSFFIFSNVCYAFNSAWDETFETYGIGDLNSNEKWATSHSDFDVVNNPVFEGSRGVYLSTNDTRHAYFIPNSVISTGQHTWSFKTKAERDMGSMNFKFVASSGNFFTLSSIGYTTQLYYLGGSGEKIDCDTHANLGGGNNYAIQLDEGRNIAMGQWLEVYLDADFDARVVKITAHTSTNDWDEFCMWFNADQTAESLEKLDAWGYWTHSAFDDLVQWTPPPIEPTISMVSPSSGSTITDILTNLVGTWTGIDPNIYYDIEFSFSSGAIGESTETFFISELNGGTGSFAIPLSEFSLPSNGVWNLKATATYRNTQLSDMLISQNLVSPEGYYLNLNVEGLPTAYQFTDFPTWYSANAAGGYEYPSDFANSITDFFTPIFEKAGEFTNRTLQYFNSQDAYSRGNQLGSVFPITQAYLDKINVFFGGFPLIQFFEFLIIVMLGIFIIRTIFKFIPFFG